MLACAVRRSQKQIVGFTWSTPGNTWCWAWRKGLHQIRIWVPGGSWTRPRILSQLFYWVPFQLLHWLWDPDVYLYWVEDSRLWYLFERDRMPTRPCSDTLGRLRSFDRRLPSVLSHIDFCHYVSWICMGSHTIDYNIHYTAAFCSGKTTLALLLYSYFLVFLMQLLRLFSSSESLYLEIIFNYQ
ncbi:hypothetical protein RchiOBHm_Chr5g0038221 [Rosa chinensis]|uniref:Uncharacterized protein n=1 Tax=Rosa chinensis TaxID=74649 RepID=A0A2P6QBY0_ROSCH|nr:hypothetical protein RchiOBHm_Chr5g0038221 [Rosa chinensis]